MNVGGDEDRAAFEDAMEEVTPLNTTPRDVTRGVREVTPGLSNRRAAAVADAAPADIDARLTLGDVPQLAPHDIVGWKRDGVQDGVFKNLKLGRYPIEAQLDLHRKTVKESRAEVLRFVRLAQAKGWRSVLVSHGRGERSPTPARIKSYVVHWLSQMDEVLAFHSAERRHGGVGSVYVLLRKSKDKSEENRQRHGSKSEDW